jgi:hypothetical protein
MCFAAHGFFTGARAFFNEKWVCSAYKACAWTPDLIAI